jgi:hypothetical protein
MTEQCCNCGKALEITHAPAPPELNVDNDPDWRGAYHRGQIRCKCGHGCHVWYEDDIPGFRESGSSPCCNGMCPCIPSPVHVKTVCSVPETISKRNYGFPAQQGTS